ncbi:MAG: bifunctional 2-C-methyl-D-erythritol 4-phosphate cytidylyltransferase/2-C-methyl-D-erythritol 2,4-cyclodiphosphate synthase [Alphaproteobacteria bacterium]|nr:bifunctional 2-C-methyl-D-erythritol 4-phosphate cytidylyltransferase/2-C-methyl-D-erythritol 2,4-cyclodiphosphate synthase [Alphaproteobacteria bacterium]
MALIVAAGRGERFGGEVPKLYRPLAGRPLLAWSAERLGRHPGIDGARVVIRAEDADLYARATAGLPLLAPVTGGATRQDSARLGLESLVPLAPERVLIHDAARPFPSVPLIDRLIAALAEGPAAIASVPVTDTLKRGGDDGRIAATVPRAGLWRAQTPQAFHFEAILAAHRQAAGQSLTDDAAVAEAAGLPVVLIAGDEDNIKVTEEADLRRAQRILGEAETRTGFGFDVHRFGPGDHVMLCGLAVPHDSGLLGHSDADVGLHAVTDALLGAIGDGDIGQHFPPSDPAWRDVDSARFAAHAAARVRAVGGRIVHVDVTLVCEAPRVAPHRERMRDRLAGILGVDRGRISVKATTTERLGFTGRGEGIAAQAIATVCLPAARP